MILLIYFSTSTIQVLERPMTSTARLFAR